MVQLFKGGSSKWIHETFSQMRNFAWQDGYGAFTVSKSQIHEIVRYIQGQQDPHRVKTFQEEYLDFLENTVLNMTKDTCGDDFHRRYAPNDLGVCSHRSQAINSLPKFISSQWDDQNHPGLFAA